MSIQTRGNSWQATIIHKGDRYRRQFATEDEARIWEAEAKVLLLKGRSPAMGEQAKNPGKPHTMRELADLVIEARWRGKRGEAKQLVNVEQVVRLLGESTTIERVDALAVTQMAIKFRALGNSDSTINKKCSALRVMLDEAVKLEIIAKAPAIPHHKEFEKRQFRINPGLESDILRCLRHAGEHDVADYVTLSIDTGMRQGEALRLRWTDARSDAITLYETKGGKNRVVPLTVRARDILAKRYETNQDGCVLAGLQPRRIWAVWNHMQAHLGLLDEEAFTPHGLRHEFCSRLGDAGVAAQAIQRLAGHANLTTSQRYIHLSPLSLESAIRALEPA